MNKERRNNLRRVVNRCRKILEEDIERRLSYYGIMPDGTLLELDELKHLTPADIETRKRLELAIKKEMIGGLSKKEAILRYIAHTAFTFLNRIAALRAMEVRKLIKETIIQRNIYGGRSLREREIAEAYPHLSPYEVLKKALIQAFQEVSEEIKILFDMNSEYSIVFPGERACKEIIKLLTEEVTEDDWKEDDIIGWIYQYFNDEARREYRKAKRKPKPDDVPVINQFYTPHWIVKALVDNTLGRLWVEMHPDSKVKKFCTYLVPLRDKPSKREIKRVRDIKVLDPACGSGHFLVYAFDVLYLMYQEDEPDTPVSEIPALILENNLFGIDIDLRAVQLAALSLYLKAKTYNPSLKIRKMNLVCADVRISDGKRRSEFLERFSDDPDLQGIFKRLFKDLSYTYEIGSLLKVRQPFERLFRERKSGEKQARFLVKPSKDFKTNLVMVIPKKRTIEEMLEELREFEQEAFEVHDMSRVLFATETEKSVGLLALLSQKYDVVLMNPPYGDMPAKTKEYLLKHYPRTHFDYYAAFIEQAIDLTQEEGYIGAITGRTFMFLKSYKWLRETLLTKIARPQIILDLGFNVLDIAMARWAAFTLSKRRFTDTESKIIFIRLLGYKERERIAALEDALKAIKNRREHELVFKVSLEELSLIPNMPYSYWTTNTFRFMFKKYPSLDKDNAKKYNTIKIATLVAGFQTSGYMRTVRRFFEVFPFEIGKDQKWIPLAKGGKSFYSDIDLVIEGRIRTEIKNMPYCFYEGICWPDIVSSIRLGMYLIPKDVIFGMGAAHGLFPVKDEFKFPLIAFCNSYLATYLFNLLDPLQHHRHIGYISQIPIAPEVLKSKKLHLLAEEAYDLLKEWDTGNEISTQFIKPWILQILDGFNPDEKPITQHPLTKEFKWSNWPSTKEIRSIKGSKDILLKELAELCIKRQHILEKRLIKILKEIDEEVYSIYGISDEEKLLVERQLGLTNTKVSYTPIISVSEHVKRLLSYYVKKAVESDEDGIVPFDEMFPDNIFNKVLKFIAQDFGKERVDKIEIEISEILGKSLKKWIEEDYFDFHVSLYRRRPIFWQLTSSRLGKGKLPGVFSCFVYYHKLDRDTIPKILAFYVKPIKDRLYREKSRIFKNLKEARASGNRKTINKLSKAYENILNQIDEIEHFEKALNILHNPRRDKTKLKKDAKWIDRVIAEIRDNGWNPIIDYGVRVNIEPLKELKLLHPATDRVK